LGGYNAATDPRHTRRAFTDDEVGRLLDVAERGPVVLGMAGPDRAMAYRTALGSGFRAGELRSLTPESFDLDGDPPTVTVAAAYSKRRRRDVQPIRRDLAERLRTWLADKPAGVPVLNLPDKAATMLRVDLDAAGIAYRDDAGRVADFHSLRHTFITNLTQGGVYPKLAHRLLGTVQSP
jgi:integrase